MIVAYRKEKKSKIQCQSIKINKKGYFKRREMSGFSVSVFISFFSIFLAFSGFIDRTAGEVDRKQGKRRGVTRSKGTRAGSRTRVRCRASAHGSRTLPTELCGAPVCSFLCTKYLVWITASVQRGMEAISRCFCSGVTEAQVALSLQVIGTVGSGLSSSSWQPPIDSGKFALSRLTPWSLTRCWYLC